MNAVVLWLIVLLMGSQAAFVEAGERDAPREKGEPVARLQEHIENLIRRHPDVPSIALHVSSSRLGLTFDGTAGVIDRESGRPLRPEHPFRLASITKTYTAASILRLAESGKLDIRASIEKYLPKAYVDPLRSDGYALSKITVTHLLTHTSGMFDHASDPRYIERIMADPDKRWTRAEQVGLCVEFGEPKGKPGEYFQYSDTGYILLGEIVERVSGKPLAEAFPELLKFKDLGLEVTRMEVPDAGKLSVPRAHQYLGDTDTHDWDPSLDLYGGGGLISTAGELAIFFHALLGGKVFDRPETLETMLTAVEAKDGDGYRMGLEPIDVDGHRGWGHRGFWNTFAYYFPDLDLAIAGSVMQREGPRGIDLVKEIYVWVRDETRPN
ncbi:Beta-lactamase family protein [Sulfidibacter corallicola]|uniref:Beta-lactamase family protein n=1 Tax=Sulfidibacter corallicola TaxID=2818388 RepID=A0A8A4THC8_SULCO|nr:serine hydrolase domain-containing protein [Sulfidibacter corallicola]QTD49469.1 beta-lactamase family protein [Sulfidibacter corallicola]